LTFTLPTKRASQRVEIWRKLQRYGCLPLGNSGYLLPITPANEEKFQWLATAIRKYAGEASVVKVHSIDNMSRPQLVARFKEARTSEYRDLIREVQELHSHPQSKGYAGRVNKLRSRLQEIAATDYFNSPVRKRAEELLKKADEGATNPREIRKVNQRDYAERIWVTRLRPGIDRCASAWLIRRSIDRKARFTFATEEDLPPKAVPFDMFHGGFGHRGEDCTFETLQKVFQLQDKNAAVIGQIVHDADLFDEKFGRKEGFGIDEVLHGWAKQGISDTELLERGIELIQALYDALSKS